MAERLWLLRSDGGTAGPIREGAVLREIKEGRFWQALVSEAGSERWQAIGTVEPFASAIEIERAEMLAQGASMPAARSQGATPAPGPVQVVGGLIPAPDQTLHSESIGDALLDVHFKQFATPRLLRFAYLCSAIFAVLGVLWVEFGAIATAFDGGRPSWQSVVLPPFAGFAFIVFSRVVLELVSVLYRIADDIHAMRHRR